MARKPPLSVGLRVSGWGVVVLVVLGILDGLVVYVHEPNSGLVVMFRWVIAALPAVFLLAKERALARKQESPSDAPETPQANDAPEGWLREQLRRVPAHHRILFAVLGMAMLGVCTFALIAGRLQDSGPQRVWEFVIVGGLALFFVAPMTVLSAISRPFQFVFRPSPVGMSFDTGLFLLVYYIYLLMPLGLMIFTRPAPLQRRWLLGTQAALVLLHLLILQVGARNFQMM